MSPKKRTKIRFKSAPIHKRVEPPALKFLTQRSSFWIATISVFAFVVGNMVGQHGWYVFWKSVMGKDAVQIAYTGTVAPVEYVPDYVRWARDYGGNPHDHTFRQVPDHLLVPLPQYDARSQHRHMELSDIGQVYSVGHAGSYATGGDNDGGHPGVDIRLPIGTPILSVANGIIESVRESPSFGKIIVVRHPNVPDPSRPRRKTTTLYSVYAHLSEMYPKVGDIVHKGDQIALSGDTGFATGPHLHFQMQRQEAGPRPYWPFTGSEARSAGMTTYQAINKGLHKERLHKYTVHPMLYVQADYPSVSIVVSADDEVTDRVTRQRSSRRLRSYPTRESRASRLQSRRNQRMQARMARRTVVGSTEVARRTEATTTVVREEVVQTPDTAGTPASVEITHDGSFDGRGWEQVWVRLLDSDGNRASAEQLGDDIHMRTAYGEADFRPETLNMQHFADGEALVQMRARGRRTVVIQVHEFPDNLSKPMKYSR